MAADLQEVGAARDLPSRAVERDSQPSILRTSRPHADRNAPYARAGPDGAIRPGDRLPRIAP